MKLANQKRVSSIILYNLSFKGLSRSCTALVQNSLALVADGHEKLFLGPGSSTSVTFSLVRARFGL